MYNKDRYFIKQNVYIRSYSKANVWSDISTKDWSFDAQKTKDAVREVNMMKNVVLQIVTRLIVASYPLFHFDLYIFILG